MLKTSKKKKEITKFRVRLRTKNFTAESLRDKLYNTFFSKPVIVRLGSLTPVEEITSRTNILEINRTEAIEISRNKREMKEAFTRVGVKTAVWFQHDNKAFYEISHMSGKLVENKDLPYPILSKSLFGQGGNGNTLHKDQKSLENWMKGKDLSNYIFEEYYNYAREYRLHVTQNGNFLSWRKLRKNDAKDRWYFNSDNCVWVGEENPLFDKPVNWEEIQQNAILACKAVGLDICAVDVRVQSSKDKDDKVRTTCDFIVLETNSAPSLRDKGSEFYYNEIVKLINNKL
jgi:glutathione synthase/RimK-type ligase-like ATP-grasp enzyme